VAADNNKIQSLFERFGWENVGGSCYRYPALAAAPGPEDWLNCVIPALMLFRSYVLARGVTVSRYSLDAHSSTGHDGVVGQAPSLQPTFLNDAPTNPTYGKKHLKSWLIATRTAVPY
jgi:hypothetical protein